MLLQVRYHRRQAPEDDDTRAAKKAAFATLKTMAGKGHSIRLAALAAKVHMATKGHFDLVITQVDKLIEELREEQQTDIDLRDHCQEEENKVANEIDDRARDMKLTTELIERLNDEKRSIQEDVRQSEADIKETEDTMAEALSSRNAENEDFKSALKDDMDQVALIASAIDALSEFYKANKLPMGALLQLKKQPEYSEDPDKMPETGLRGALRRAIKRGWRHRVDSRLPQGGHGEGDQDHQGGGGQGVGRVQRAEERGPRGRGGAEG